MKKKTKKVVRSKPRKSTTEIVVRVQNETRMPVIASETDLNPVKEGGKYMIPKTWMSEKQVLRIVQKTPPQHIYQRPGKGGGTWSYITASYVEKVLNYTFGWAWDFEVMSHGREENQVWVLGKLTVKDDHGHSIIKTQFGRADIKIKKGTKEMMDFGNDLKAATSDALKKCASLLGIGSDIYGKMEFKQEAGYEVRASTSTEAPQGLEAPKNIVTKPKLGQIMGPDGKLTYMCSVTDTPISDQEYEYSMKVFGKALSREAQKDYKAKK